MSVFFFFKQKTAYEVRISDWSSDVCSSDPQLTIQRMPFTLITQFEDEGAGTAISLYPGCDHRRMTCKDKFNNILNYGGFDWIPTKNPMGGDRKSTRLNSSH